MLSKVFLNQTLRSGSPDTTNLFLRKKNPPYILFWNSLLLGTSKSDFMKALILLWTLVPGIRNLMTSLSKKNTHVVLNFTGKIYSFQKQLHKQSYYVKIISKNKCKVISVSLLKLVN